MKKWTWLEIKTKVQADLDLQQEEFITESELLGYANEAIDEAESLIHTIYEDYFLSLATLTMVKDQQKYDLPDDIYANKIRLVQYKNGTDYYPIKRIKLTEIVDIESNDDYMYKLINTLSEGQKFYLYPAAREAGAYITIWYIRNATWLTTNTSKCDIPEFVSFVIQYIKWRCYEKEGHPNLELANNELVRQRQLMVTTLTDMVIDEDTKIDLDLTHYREMS